MGLLSDSDLLVDLDTNDDNLSDNLQSGLIYLLFISQLNYNKYRCKGCIAQTQAYACFLFHKFMSDIKQQKIEDCSFFLIVSSIGQFVFIFYSTSR